MNLPDLADLTQDTLITARAVLYLASFLYGFWAGHLFGHRVVHHAKRVHQFFKRR